MTEMRKGRKRTRFRSMEYFYWMMKLLDDKKTTVKFVLDYIESVFKNTE